MRAIRYCLLCVWLVCASAGYAQDSCSLRISLITCAPGSELYSSFGHTAIRVQDLNNGSDLVYNYGTFEFGPDFYVQFVKGRLNYFLSVEDFPNFLWNYQMESRSVAEQQLQLNCSQKAALNADLQRNALPQNRYYRYQFLYDNCTTRARDMIQRHAGPGYRMPDIKSGSQSFRELIHQSLDSAHQSWSKLGIDLLLGLPVDKVSGKGATFRPGLLLEAINQTTVDHHPIASPPQTLLKMPSPLGEAEWFTPALVFSLIAACSLAMSFLRPHSKALLMLDAFIFLITGLAGVIMLLMWTATDHEVCAWNFNLLWALPTNLVAIAVLRSFRTGPRRFFKYLSFYYMLLLLVWFFLPQHLNPALLPIVITLAFRSFQIAQYAKRTDRT